MGSGTTAINAVIVNLLLLFLLKAICFLLGYLTVRLGYALIRDGAKGDFTFKADLAGFKADLASVSPGLLFVLLGIGLIGYAMYVNKVVDYREDRPAAAVSPKPPDSPLP